MTKTYDLPDDQLRYDMALDAAADLVLRITQIRNAGADEAISDLVAKVNYCLEHGARWGLDDTFCFPDGDIWHRKTDGFATESQLEDPWLDADNAAT